MASNSSECQLHSLLLVPGAVRAGVQPDNPVEVAAAILPLVQMLAQIDYLQVCWEEVSYIALLRSDLRAISLVC